LQGKGTVAADTAHGRPGETGALVPGASTLGPTRPAPFVHPGAQTPPPAFADTTKKPPASEKPEPKKPELEQ